MNIARARNSLVLKTFSFSKAKKLPLTTFIDIQALAKNHLATMTDDQLDKDWKLTDFFGCIYVINLKDATKRLHDCFNELKCVGVKEQDIEVLPAIDGRREVKKEIWKKFTNWSNIDTSTKEGKARLTRQLQGEAGCYLSHLKVIETVRENYTLALAALKAAPLEKQQEARLKVKKYSSVLILEDDNGFGFVDSTCVATTKTHAGVIFRKAMSELPPNWDMIYLMSKPLEAPIQYSPHLAKLTKSLVTNAVVINRTMYDVLYEELGKIHNKDVEIHPIDGQYAGFHSTKNCFGTVPSITYQSDGFSSITSREVPKYIQKQSIKNDMAALYGDVLRETKSFNANPFKEDECTIADLPSRIEQLEQHDLKGFSDLNKKIGLEFKRHLDDRRAQGDHHDFQRTQTNTRFPIELYSCDISLENTLRYIVHDCPETTEDAASIFDTALNSNIDLLVSTVRSAETPKRSNIFWGKDKNRIITTKTGWKVLIADEDIIKKENTSKIVETTLKAIHDNGQVKTLTLLHFDGWEEENFIPNRKLFQIFLDRIEELQAQPNSPFSIISRWGFGRNAVVALSHFLRSQKNANTINIPKIVYECRKQCKEFLEHTPQLADVYNVFNEYLKNDKFLKL